MRDNPSNAMSRVQLAVLTARFEGVARKMANTLHRTGRSGILTIAREAGEHRKDFDPCAAYLGLFVAMMAEGTKYLREIAMLDKFCNISREWPTVGSKNR